MLSLTRSTIPAELLEEFFEYAVARGEIDFKTGALVSLRWRELCQRKLFETVYISATNITGIHSVGTESRHIHLAKYIKNIHVVDLPSATIPNSRDLLPSHFASFTSFLHTITEPKHMLLGHSHVDWSKLPSNTILAFLHVLGQPSFETLEVVGGIGFPVSLLYGVNIQNLSLEVVHGIIPPHPAISHLPIHGRLCVMKLLDRASLQSFLGFVLNEEQLAGDLFKNLHMVHLRVHDCTQRLLLGSLLVSQFIGHFGHFLKFLYLHIDRHYPINVDEPFIMHENLSSLVNLEKLELTLSVGMLFSSRPVVDYIGCHVTRLIKGLPWLVCLRTLMLRVRLSVPGRPGAQECFDINEETSQRISIALGLRKNWPSVKEVKCLIELCGDNNTAMERAELKLDIAYGVRLFCLTQTGSI